MKIVAAPDSYKGSLTAVQAAQSMAAGIRRVMPDAQVVQLPVADGGEGTTEAFYAAAGGERYTVQVTGPLGDPVQAVWLRLPDGTGVMEMAQASGITLIPRERLDPLRATSYGTGELLRAMLDAGCRKILLGIGGSATNDGGAGMMQALGARFLDAAGKELAPGGAALERLEHIDLAGWDKRVQEASITVACDVTNPLCGPQGASAVYGPQKGADAPMAALLDKALARYAEVIQRQLGKDVAQLPGAGAAGGLGAGLLAFCGAQMRPGIETVLQAVGFDQLAEGACAVFTGEGRLDGQSVNGKVPAGVAAHAKAVRPDMPVIAVGGSIGAGAEGLYACGVDGMLSLVDSIMPLERAMTEAAGLLEAAVERAMCLLLAGRRMGF